MKNNYLSKTKSFYGKFLGVLFVCGVLLVLPRFFATENSAKSETVKMLFVGDIMLSRQIEVIANREENPIFHFLKIGEVTRSADIAFGNLESPVSVRGQNLGSIYSFRASPKMLEGLVYAGFDIVSVANNHAFDWGPDAFLDTQMHLEKVGIVSVGGGKDIAEARKPVIIERNGAKFAYLAYSEFATKYPSSNYPAVAPLDRKKMKEDVMGAKLLADVVVVSIHWGAEYETRANDEQKTIARELVDQGALLVIGHHPHVVQEVEEYGDGLIAYSLGNFVFDQNFSQDTSKGLMLKVEISDKKIARYEEMVVRFTPMFQVYSE
jgi:poly-gamma-glutamate capsule biosynthesis protein CapA/YwtB (metallophosphatase superfamily)